MLKNRGKQKNSFLFSVFLFFVFHSQAVVSFSTFSHRLHFRFPYFFCFFILDCFFNKFYTFSSHSTSGFPPECGMIKSFQISPQFIKAISTEKNTSQIPLQRGLWHFSIISTAPITTTIFIIILYLYRRYFFISKENRCFHLKNRRKSHLLLL